MPSWAWILLAAAIVGVAIGVAFAARAAGQRKRSERLKEHFGPEYERTLSEAGDPRSAEKELVAREKQRDKLDIRPLPADALADFDDRWRAVQTSFVDDPASAVDEADRLVTEVMRARGYPVDDFERRASDISVDHPLIVDHYRAAHDVHTAQGEGDIGTEQQRQAFVHYRALFDVLLEPEPEPTPDATEEARA